jgi:hypothetical protein
MVGVGGGCVGDGVWVMVGGFTSSVTVTVRVGVGVEDRRVAVAVGSTAVCLGLEHPAIKNMTTSIIFETIDMFMLSPFHLWVQNRKPGFRHIGVHIIEAFRAYILPSFANVP